MTDELVHFKLDSIAGNVSNLENVLEKFKIILNLKPFIKFELILKDSKTFPVVLIMCGKYTIELIEQKKNTKSAGMGNIGCLVFEGTNLKTGYYELEPGLNIKAENNQRVKKTRLKEININSSKIGEDKETLMNKCRFNQDKDVNSLKLFDIALRFYEIESQLSDNDIKSVLEDDVNQALAGWHRIGLLCRNLKKATDSFAKDGAGLLVPPYKVMAGLNESMVYLPSGVVLQLGVQKLWKMLPFLFFKGIISKIKGKPIQFKPK